jgi:hypothetical protein
MTGANRLAELEDEARYTRERLELYRAKSYGPRETSPDRLRKLERAAEAAEARLRAARSDAD